MAIARLDEQFTWDRQALQPELRKFTQAVESRLKPLDDKIVNYDVVVGQLTATGLDRVNEILIPAVQSVIDLTDLGFMTAPSTYSVALDTGPATWVIDAGPQRTNFRPTPWVYIQHNEVLGDWAVGRLIDYDHVSGVLELDIEFIPVGADPGPHVNWTLSMSPAATPTLLSEVPTAADLNTKYADVLVKWAATVAAASAAAASAAAAATFDPSSYYTKTAADARYYTQTQADARYYTITVMDAALAGKAASSHTHVAANITDFNAAADARVALSPAFVIGDVIDTVRSPGANYLLLDGALYTTATYTALQALLGNKYARFNAPTLPTVPSGLYPRILYEPSLSLFIAAGHLSSAGALVTSPDAVTWTSRDTTASRAWHALASNGTKLMIADQTAPAPIKTSTNGTTWSAGTNITFAADILNASYEGALLAAFSLWIAFGDDTGTVVPEIRTSVNDGSTWASQTSAFLSGEIPGAAAFGNGIVVQLSITNAGVWQTSTNGTAWTRRTGGGWSVTGQSVRFVGGYFIITCQMAGRGAIFISTDGINWTKSLMPPGLVVPAVGNTVNTSLIGYHAPLWAFSVYGLNWVTLVTSDLVRFRIAVNPLIATGVAGGSAASNGTIMAFSPASMLINTTTFDNSGSQFRVPLSVDDMIPRWIKAL